MSGCKPSTYRSIVFLKSWIVGLVPTVWVSRLETVFGAVCWHLLTVFLNMMLNKYYSILWVHPNLVGNMAVFVARFGYLITTPNLLHFGLKLLCWRLPEDVRTRCCQSIFEQPFTITNQNTQLNKNTSVTGKTQNAQKKCPYGFPGIWYTHIRDMGIQWDTSVFLGAYGFPGIWYTHIRDMGIHEIHQFLWGHTVFQVYDIHILEAWEYMRYIFFLGVWTPNEPNVWHF